MFSRCSCNAGAHNKFVMILYKKTRQAFNYLKFIAFMGLSFYLYRQLVMYTAY